MYGIFWKYKGIESHFQTVNKESANDVLAVLKQIPEVTDLCGKLLTIDVAFPGRILPYTYISDFEAERFSEIVVPTPYGDKTVSVTNCLWRKRSELTLPLDKYKKTIRLA